MPKIFSYIIIAIAFFPNAVKAQSEIEDSNLLDFAITLAKMSNAMDQAKQTNDENSIIDICNLLLEKDYEIVDILPVNYQQQNGEISFQGHKRFSLEGLVDFAIELNMERESLPDPSNSVTRGDQEGSIAYISSTIIPEATLHYESLPCQGDMDIILYGEGNIKLYIQDESNDQLYELTYIAGNPPAGLHLFMQDDGILKYTLVNNTNDTISFIIASN